MYDIFYKLIIIYSAGEKENFIWGISLEKRILSYKILMRKQFFYPEVKSNGVFLFNNIVNYFNNSTNSEG